MAEIKNEVEVVEEKKVAKKTTKTTKTATEKATTAKKTTKTTKTTKAKAKAKAQEFLGTGKRKCSVARVRVTTGNGTITVNGVDVAKYFDLDTHIAVVKQPLVLTDTAFLSSGRSSGLNSIRALVIP